MKTSEQTTKTRALSLFPLGAAPLALVLVLAAAPLFVVPPPAAPAPADAVRGEADESPGPKAARRGLKRLAFSEDGMSYASHIRFIVGTRREAGRDVFRLLHRRADVVAECALSDADVSALEALLVKHRLLSWGVGRGSAVGPAGNVTDGGGFSLSLEYTDGRKARARGGTFSKEYQEARDEIRGFLGDVLKRSGARPTRMKRIEFERLQRELSK